MTSPAEIAAYKFVKELQAKVGIFNQEHEDIVRRNYRIGWENGYDACNEETRRDLIDLIAQVRTYLDDIADKLSEAQIRPQTSADEKGSKETATE